MEDKFPFKENGEKLKQLIEARGLTVYKFAKMSFYSNSRIYKLINGECDIANIETYNAIMFARILGFKYVDDLFEALGIDILSDLR